MSSIAVRPVNWKSNLIGNWIGQILCMAGYSAIMPFIPLFIRDRYNITDERELGMWVSAFTFFGFLSFCFSNPLWGMLADRYGRKLMLLRSYYVSTILFPLLYFSPSVVWLIVVRFFISCFSGSVTASQILVVTTTPKEHHGFALGVLSSAVWSGNMIGFLAGAFFVDLLGYKWGFIGCGILYLLGGIITHVLVRENFVPPEKKAEKKSVWKELRSYSAAIWIMLILFVLMGLARQIEFPYVPILVSRITEPDKAVFYTGVISLAAAVGGLISGIVLGRLCDKFPPMLVAVPAVIISAITLVLQAAAATPFQLGTWRFINYTAGGGLDPAFQAMLARLSPEEKRGTLFGFAASLRIVGVMLASLLGGGIIYVTDGIKPVFICGGVLFLLLLPLIFCAMSKIKKQH